MPKTIQTMSDEELVSLSEKIYKELNARKENLEKITWQDRKIGKRLKVKDFLVAISNGYTPPKDFIDGRNYSGDGIYFQILVRDGLKCAYYDINDEEFEEDYLISTILPYGFSEMSENAYEYRGTVREGIKKLLDYKFEVIHCFYGNGEMEVLSLKDIGYE